MVRKRSADGAAVAGTEAMEPMEDGGGEAQLEPRSEIGLWFLAGLLGAGDDGETVGGLAVGRASVH